MQNNSTISTQPESLNTVMQIADDEETKKIHEELKTFIVKNIHSLKVNGYLTLALTFMVAFGIYLDIKISLGDQLMKLEASAYPNQTVLYLIFRSSVLGAIATTVLVFGAKISISSFDQAMRFTKRNMGTLFLQFLHKQHNKQLRDNVTLDQLMASFETWNKM